MNNRSLSERDTCAQGITAGGWNDRPSMSTVPAYLRFWGKASAEVRSGEPPSHPVAYHCLDVAAVADVLLKSSPRTLRTMARLLTTSPNNARRLLVALIALHDVGKFSAAFQTKSQVAWPSDILGDWMPLPGGRHDEVGSAVRRMLGLKAFFGSALQRWSSSDFDDLWHAVAGHHGRPRVTEALLSVEGMTSACIYASSAFCADVATLFGFEVEIPRPELPSLATLSWAVAGLTVISDWIGSNRHWFPYREPALTVAEYWPEALTRAEAAVARAGVLPAPVPDEFTPARLLPELAQSLSPLQRKVLDLAVPDGPMLAIIEEVTGSGKTEAALLLAARLLAADRANGLYFALPTMATANAMFERLNKSYVRLFADGAQPSLVLAHGKRELYEGFTSSILRSSKSEQLGGDGYEESATASCSAWIADDRRKAFLAHVGVGTIDQALLSVLPSRHQSLRLWGLSNRVLIIDEAHAYDAYMSKEVETLLEFQAALGGSAIILSATLPAAQRRSMVKAFANGLGTETHATASGDAYPLMTVVSESQAASLAISSRADRSRVLPVRRIGTVDEAVAHVAAMAQRGAAVAWIRNAVDDAIDAVDRLRHRGLNPLLIHARFAMGDRLDIEERVRATLGRDGVADKRRGFVVVGTQILEQSLDYDVDAMITDLAPIDLMIQRAGRLWRHAARTDRPIDAAELLVLSPDPAEIKDKNWYRTLSARAAAVYDHHGIVWRSAKVLFERGCIETPGGVRDLIERVYAPTNFDDIPDVLRAQCHRAEGERGAARSHANANLLKLVDGYGGCSALWTTDSITPTRLAEPVTVFRLGKIEGERIVAWCQADEAARAWAISEISVSKNRADGVPKPDGQRASMVQAAKSEWPEWERELPLLVLEPTRDGSHGIITKQGQDNKPILYDRRIGLRFVAASQCTEMGTDERQRSTDHSRSASLRNSN